MKFELELTETEAHIVINALTARIDEIRQYAAHEDASPNSDFAGAIAILVRARRLIEDAQSMPVAA